MRSGSTMTLSTRRWLVWWQLASVAVFLCWSAFAAGDFSFAGEEETTETTITLQQRHHLRRRSLVSLLMAVAPSDFGSVSQRQQQHYGNDPPGNDDDDDDDDDPLVRWLDRLRVDIPDQSFSAKLVTVHIEGLHCTHFSVQHLDSELLQQQQQQPNNANTNTLQIRVRQVAASCQGSYRATGGASGTINAQLTTIATTTTTTCCPENEDPVAIAWVVSVLDSTNTTRRADDIREPAWVETEACETALQVTGLHFSGSLSAKLMELFRESIESHANGAIEKQICPVIRHQLDPLLSNYLQRAVQWLRPYYFTNTTRTATKIMIHETPIQLDESSLRFLAEALPAKERHGDDNEKSVMIDFARDLPILTSALLSTNSFIEKHLNHGLLPVPANTSMNHETTQCQSALDDCGGFLFCGLNGVLRELLQWVDEEDYWTLPIPPVHLHFVLPRYAAIALHIDQVTIAGEGLYQWTNMTLLRPYQLSSSSPFFQTALETPGNLSIAAHMVVNVSSIPGSMFRSEHPLIESFVVRVNTTSLKAVLNLAVELKRQRFEHVTVAMLLNVFRKLWDPFFVSSEAPDAACLLDSIQNLTTDGLTASVNLSHFSILPTPGRTYGVPSRTSMSDQLEQDLDKLISNTVQLFLSGYQPLVSASIEGLVRGPAQHQLNQFLESSIQIDSNSSTTNCTFDQDSGNPHWVNFTELQPLRQLNALLNDQSTLTKINTYIDCSANLVNRVIEETLLNNTGNFSETSSLGLRRLRIDHPGNVQLMEILAPVRDGKHLESGVSVKSNNSDSQPQLSVSFDLDYKPLDLFAKIDATLYLDGIDWVGGSILRLDSNVFRRMTLMELFSHGQCFLAPADQVELYQSKTRLGDFHVLVSASLTTASLSELDVEATQLISFDSKTYPVIQSTASTSFVWLVNTLQDVANGFLRAGVAQAPDRCNSESNSSSSDDEEDESIGFDMNTLFLILAAVYIFLQPTILLMKRSRESTGQGQGSNAHDETELMEPLLHPRYSDEIVQAQSSRFRKPSSLMFHPRVPEVARHLVPISILLTIAMLLASNLSTGASVIPVISQKGGAFQLPSLFDFGLYNTAKDMLEAKIYPLFLLVVGFSGIWPYAKLFLMLAAWAAPESVLNKDTRGALLLKLDALSKFSLVDTYVLVVMLVAFRFHVELINDAVLDVYVAPKTGFYGFLVATSASLVIGHILVYYNRKTELHLELDDDSRDSVFSHEFALSDGSHRRLSQACKKLLVVLLFTTFVLLGFGISQQSFRFEFGGLAGLVLGDERVTSYSLLSLGAAIPKSVEKPTGAAVYILQAAFYFYAVVTPFAALFFLLLALVYPLTLRRQCQIITLAEIANAWSAIEVFAMSIIAALLEISTFASFIIGSRCDVIDEILKDFDTGDVDSCYTVKSTVTWRSTFLVLGAILNSGWVSFVFLLVHLSFHERIQGGFNRHSPSVVQRLVGWKPTSWIVESEDAEGPDNDASPPVFTEQMISEPADEACGFDEEWKEVTRVT